MKRNKILYVVVLVLMAGLTFCTGQSNEDDKIKRGWTLVWDDDFDGGGYETSWSSIPRGKLPMNRYMSDNEALYVFQGGNIVLRGMENVATNGETPFLTGGIVREGIKKNSVRRIEVRARINPVPGAVPFITLIPSDGTQQIKIDLMEQYGTDKFVYQSITSEYTTTQGMPDNPPSSALVGVKPSQYHTYAVEKYADSLVFYVNESRTKIYPRILTDIPGQFPFDDLDFDLHIGLRLNKDTQPEVLPADMFIDWVRFYEPETVSANK